MKHKLDARGVIIRCSECDTSNRVPFARLNTAGTCGSCKATLPLPHAPMDVRDGAHFDALVAASPVPVLVDFWAPWCGPCLSVAPELERAAAASRGEFLVVKIDTQAHPGLGARFGVRAIPTMAVFEGGAERDRRQGAIPAHQIEQFARGR